MAAILIIYSTTDGHTRKICHRLQQQLEFLGDHTELLPIEQVATVNWDAFDKIVIGASIRYGRHARLVHEFIADHQAQLERRPNAFFSVNLVARKKHKRTPDSNPYARRFLAQITWKPHLVAVFAGKLNYSLYGFWDRNIIRMIMWITGGPTHFDARVEYTDWTQVEAFGREFHQM